MDKFWNFVGIRRGRSGDNSTTMGAAGGECQGQVQADERLPMATFWPRRDSCCSGSCSGGGGGGGSAGGRCVERCRRRCGTWTECGASCSRILLITVNFAFLIFGAMFVVLSFLLYVDTDSKVYADLLHTMPSSGPLVVLEKIPAIFFTVGLVVLALSFLGCYGACSESVCFLWLYTILLFLILTAQIITGTMLAVFRDEILKRLQTTMQYQIRHEYNKTALPSNATNATTLQVTSLWDTMQIQLKCCGAVGPNDYKFSSWHNRTKSGERLFVPASCCNLLDDSNHNACQIDAIIFPQHSSRVLKTQGCGESALQRLSANAGGLFFVMFMLTVLQVTHFMFACSLLTRIRRSSSDYQWYEVENCGT